jgi:hypothetical protein
MNVWVNRSAVCDGLPASTSCDITFDVRILPASNSPPRWVTISHKATLYQDPYSIYVPYTFYLKKKCLYIMSSIWYKNRLCCH